MKNDINFRGLELKKSDGPANLRQYFEWGCQYNTNAQPGVAGNDY